MKNSLHCAEDAPLSMSFSSFFVIPGVAAVGAGAGAEAQQPMLRKPRPLVAGPDFKDDDVEPGLLSYAVGCAFGILFIGLHWLLGSGSQTSSSSSTLTSTASVVSSAGVPGHTRRRSTASMGTSNSGGGTGPSTTQKSSSSSSNAGGSHVGGSKKKSGRNKKGDSSSSGAAGSTATSQSQHQQQSAMVSGGRQSAGSSGRGEDFDQQKTGSTATGKQDRLTDFDDDEAFEALLAKLSGGAAGTGGSTAETSFGTSGPQSSVSTTTDRGSGNLSSSEGSRGPTPDNENVQEQSSRTNHELDADDDAGNDYNRTDGSSRSTPTPTASVAAAAAGNLDVSGSSFFARLMTSTSVASGTKKGNDKQGTELLSTWAVPGFCTMQFTVSLLIAMFFVYVLSGGDLSTLAQYDLLLINLTTGVLVFYLSIWVCSSKASSRHPKRRYGYNKQIGANPSW